MTERTHTYDKLEYVAYVVDDFAIKYNLTTPEAYAYLRRYGAIDFLLNNYEAEHTLALEDAVNDVQEICQRQGGRVK